MNTELMISESINPIVVFSPQGSQDILDEIKRQARSVPRDISTKEGRANLASLARKIASSKVFLDDSGKRLTEDWKQRSKVVDAERKRIRDELDSLKDEIRKPLTDWENREVDRVFMHENNLKKLYATTEFGFANPSIELIHSRSMIAGSIYTGNEWEEFQERANQALDIVRETLQDALEQAEFREKERADLERLRLEEDARAKSEEAKRRKEREAEIAAEAADRAKREAERVAEANAKAAREAACKEQNRIQRERDEQERKAKQAESDRKFVEERAAYAKKVYEEKAEKDKADAIRKERERVANEKRKKEDAAKKREADEKHYSKIIEEVAAALTLYGIDDIELSYRITSMIATGKIPHVNITY